MIHPKETYVLTERIKCAVCNELKGHADIVVEHFLCIDCSKVVRIDIPEYKNHDTK